MKEIEIYEQKRTEMFFARFNKLDAQIRENIIHRATLEVNKAKIKAWESQDWSSAGPTVVGGVSFQVEVERVAAEYGVVMPYCIE